MTYKHNLYALVCINVVCYPAGRVLTIKIEAARSRSSSMEQSTVRTPVSPMSIVAEVQRPPAPESPARRASKPALHNRPSSAPASEQHSYVPSSRVPVFARTIKVEGPTNQTDPEQQSAAQQAQPADSAQKRSWCCLWCCCCCPWCPKTSNKVQPLTPQP